MKKQQQGPLKRVTLLEEDESSLAIYDEWAPDYDKDLVSAYGYRAPQLGAEAFELICPDKQALVMDFGCGTGLVGIELVKRGYTNIHGLDVSSGMLNVAQQTNAYSELMRGDLTAAIDIAHASYDALICVGIFGNGHVTAAHLPEMLRTAKPGAPFVIYLNDLAYTSLDYATQFKVHEANGLWTIVNSEPSNYMAELDRPGWAITARCTA